MLAVDARFAGPYTEIMGDAWRPEQYERFRKERSQPFYDLLGLVLTAARAPRVIDLGCGTGELTVELHRRLAAERTGALPARPAPVASPPALPFERADIGARASGWGRDPEPRFDVVFSNAA